MLIINCYSIQSNNLPRPRPMGATATGAATAKGAATLVITGAATATGAATLVTIAVGFKLRELELA